VAATKAGGVMATAPRAENVAVELLVADVSVTPTPPMPLTESARTPVNASGREAPVGRTAATDRLL
jgi:hypothetical protein